MLRGNVGLMVAVRISVVVESIGDPVVVLFCCNEGIREGGADTVGTVDSFFDK